MKRTLTRLIARTIWAGLPAAVIVFPFWLVFKEYGWGEVLETLKAGLVLVALIVIAVGLFVIWWIASDYLRRP